MRSWQTGVVAGVLFAPVSILLVARNAGGFAGLSHSLIGVSVIAATILIAGAGAGRISMLRARRQKPNPAPAIIGGLLIGAGSLAVMGLVVAIGGLLIVGIPG